MLNYPQRMTDSLHAAATALVAETHEKPLGDAAVGEVARHVAQLVKMLVLLQLVSPPEFGQMTGHVHAVSSGACVRVWACVGEVCWKHL